MVALGTDYQFLINDLKPAKDVELQEEIEKGVISRQNKRLAHLKWTTSDGRSREELYDEALKLAEEIWTQQEDCEGLEWHDQMAAWLVSVPRFKDLSKRTLMDKLKPLARRLGRLRGVKKE